MFRDSDDVLKKVSRTVDRFYIVLIVLIAVASVAVIVVGISTKLMVVLFIGIGSIVGGELLAFGIWNLHRVFLDAKLSFYADVKYIRNHLYTNKNYNFDALKD